MCAQLFFFCHLTKNKEKVERKGEDGDKITHAHRDTFKERRLCVFGI